MPVATSGAPDHLVLVDPRAAAGAGSLDFDSGAGIQGPTGFDNAARCVYGP